MAAALLTINHASPAAAEGSQTVSVTVADNGPGAEITPRFLGLSYEMSMLLPKDGKYYFDPNDRALVNTFKTLGIKSLRVGANAVDDPRVGVPDEKDADQLFDFARAANVKVIYSFRLKKGDPAASASLAKHIMEKDSDALDCLAIGNEPNFYLKPYSNLYPQWKAQYDAILQAVPQAMFDGPSANGPYALDLARDFFSGGHIAMISDHYYFLGSGRAGETNPPATRERFLSDNTHHSYERAWKQVGSVLAAKGIPYRIDELNSCYNGGSKNSSDTYASTLWCLDCTHWWAAHHILGMNYHTGESVGRDGKFGAPNYAGFLRDTNGNGFIMRPQAYAYLAFTQGAQGRPLQINLDKAPDYNFDAYAYRAHDGSVYLTLINKSYGEKAQPATVSLHLPGGVNLANAQRMDLAQKDNDVAAKTDVSLGGETISTQGSWAGQWKTINIPRDNATMTVAPASATLLRVMASP